MGGVASAGDFTSTITNGIGIGIMYKHRLAVIGGDTAIANSAVIGCVSQRLRDERPRSARPRRASVCCVYSAIKSWNIVLVTILVDFPEVRRAANLKSEKDAYKH